MLYCTLSPATAYQGEHSTYIYIHDGFTLVGIGGASTPGRERLQVVGTVNCTERTANAKPSTD